MEPDKIDTKVLQSLDIERDSANISAAADILRAGGLVVFPTETVYGIGANALDECAISKIYEAKGRPKDNPLIVHIASLSDIEPLVNASKQQSLQMQKLAGEFWPGPLTVILPRSSAVPAAVSAGLDTISVRMPSHPVARALIRGAGVPVAAPSANLSGSPSPTCASHCIYDLSGRVDMILDGGMCSVGLESTVISLTCETPRLLRPGAVTHEQLLALLGKVDIDPAVTGKIADNAVVSSPGMKYRHYAPKAKVVMVHGNLEQFILFLAGHLDTDVWAMVFDEDIPLLHVPCLGYGSSKNPLQQARRLFSSLRELDAKDAKLVYVRAPAQKGVGLAVYNRLLRASGFNEIYL